MIILAWGATPYADIIVAYIKIKICIEVLKSHNLSPYLLQPYHDWPTIKGRIC